MENIEQECEDALFALCDTRERWPKRCAEEFEKFIILTNDILMAEVIKSEDPFEVPTLTKEQVEFLNSDIIDKSMSIKLDDKAIQKMKDKVKNIRSVMEQIERNKSDSILS